MKDQMFETVEAFKYSIDNLEGRTLKMKTIKEGDSYILAGIDIDTEEVFVLSMMSGFERIGLYE